MVVRKFSLGRERNRLRMWETNHAAGRSGTCPTRGAGCFAMPVSKLKRTLAGAEPRQLVNDSRMTRSIAVRFSTSTFSQANDPPADTILRICVLN